MKPQNAKPAPESKSGSGSEDFQQESQCLVYREFSGDASAARRGERHSAKNFAQPFVTKNETEATAASPGCTIAGCVGASSKAPISSAEVY